MKRLRVIQTRSAIGRPERQKKTIQALGIKKLNKPIEVEGTPQILGMIEKIKHLIEVEEI